MIFLFLSLYKSYQRVTFFFSILTLTKTGPCCVYGQCIGLENAQFLHSSHTYQSSVVCPAFKGRWDETKDPPVTLQCNEHHNGGPVDSRFCSSKKGSDQLCPGNQHRPHRIGKGWARIYQVDDEGHLANRQQVQSRRCERPWCVCKGGACWHNQNVGHMSGAFGEKNRLSPCTLLRLWAFGRRLESDCMALNPGPIASCPCDPGQAPRFSVPPFPHLM